MRHSRPWAAALPLPALLVLSFSLLAEPVRAVERAAAVAPAIGVGPAVAVAPAIGAVRAVAVAHAVGAEPPIGADPAIGVGRASPIVPDWTQGLRYRIEASLDESTQILHGLARIRYLNRSPDTLRVFYVHEYLNAFRPNSAWARHDLAVGIHTYQDLPPEDQGFERILEARADGRPVEPFYPGAPDSTVVGFRLPRPLAPGDSITLDVRWDARPSTVPRRQGRRGRHWDFAEWYPRVAVYGADGWSAHPFYRQGEDYGEYGTFDVTLDVASDQVMGATGVPIEGDPGWEAAAAPGTDEVDYQRTWYGSVEGGGPCVTRNGVTTCGAPGRPGSGPGTAESLGLLPDAPPTGRKRVRWYAEDVHHFAWSVDPEFVYEQGSFQGTALHALYLPADSATWGGGRAIRRTATALAWLDSIFGEYGYPQVTWLHRIEGGATEFPMLVMAGSASQGLILHEVGHEYAYALLGNKQWYEGWLDEGMTSFQTSWFFERRGQGRGAWLGDEATVIDLGLRHETWPLVYPAEDYPDYGTYASMVYTKGSLVLRMLRDLVGPRTMVAILHEFYDRYEYRHVDEDAFRSVAEEVSGRDLDWFFAEWLHGTGVVDYALSDVDVDRVRGDAEGAEAGGGSGPAADGAGAGSGRAAGDAWSVGFTVTRNGAMRMPVPVRITGDEGQTKDTVVSGTSFHGRVSTTVGFRPHRIELDPDGTIVDWNGMNDVWEDRLLKRGGVARSLERPLGRMPAWRDRLAAAFLPLAWGNDAGGMVLGFERKTDYLGSMHRSLLRVGLPAFGVGDRGGLSEGLDWGSVYYRVEDPIWRDRPRFGTRLEAMLGEGRAFARVGVDRDVSARPRSGPRRSVRAYLLYSEVDDTAYLPAGRWEMQESLGGEGGLGYRESWNAAGGRLSLDVSAGIGFSTRPDRWVRGSGELAWSHEPSSGWSQRVRLFAGGAVGSRRGEDWSGDAVPRERRFGVAGAGPFATLSDPWSRSRGALLEDHAYRPGDGNLRGYGRGIMEDRVVSLGAELASARAPVGPVSVGLDVFGDLGWIPDITTRSGGPFGPGQVGDVVISVQENPILADAGAGLSVGWDDSPLALRFDVPFLVSYPELASDGRSNPFAFRWTISVVGR